MDFLIYIIIGVIAGATGAASSGGGLLSIPLLILMGISPLHVIATTRLAALVGGIASLMYYARKKLVEWKTALPYLVVLSALAGILGPKLVTHLDPRFIAYTVGTALLILSVLLLVTKSYGLVKQTRSRRQHLVGGTLILPAMLYATMFGAGGGALIINILIYFFGFKITRATATGIAIWLVGTGVAAVVYMLEGLVKFDVAIPLLLGSSLGGFIGARYFTHANSILIKNILGILIGASALKLLLS